MIDNLYRQAALNVAGEPVSIEPDGSVWADSDHRDIDEAAIQAEYERLKAEEVTKATADAAATAAAVAHAKSLGFTDAMIAVMYPNLAP
jgi:hypothetical protein